MITTLKLKTGMTRLMNSNIVLTSCILLANINVTELFEYALKAAIGGGIWLAYRMTADFIEKRKDKK